MRERAVDSEVVIEGDPERRAVLKRYALDDEVRLKVLDALRWRLCTEIWLVEPEV